MRYYLLGFTTPTETLWYDKINMKDMLIVIRENMLEYYNLTDRQYILSRDVLNSSFIYKKSTNKLLNPILEIKIYPNVKDINAVLSIKS
jgi:hypothetical protein